MSVYAGHNDVVSCILSTLKSTRQPRGPHAIKSGRRQQAISCVRYISSVQYVVPNHFSKPADRGTKPLAVGCKRPTARPTALAKDGDPPKTGV